MTRTLFISSRDFYHSVGLAGGPLARLAAAHMNCAGSASTWILLQDWSTMQEGLAYLATTRSTT